MRIVGIVMQAPAFLAVNRHPDDELGHGVHERVELGLHVSFAGNVYDAFRLAFSLPEFDALPNS